MARGGTTVLQAPDEGKDLPLLPPDGPPGRRRLRICGGILRELVQFVALTVFAPLVAVVAAGVDLVRWLRWRRPWVAVRLAALAWWFLLGELVALLAVARVWLLSGGPLASDTPTRRRRTFRLQVRWGTRHLAGLCRLFHIRFDVQGDELIGRGPMIVFSRHASIVDNALPAALISARHGIDLRYVLKSELQVLPALDIGSRWVPTCFVNRASGDPEREIERVASLASDLHGERDGVLIFPEGTRGTAEKLAALKARGDIGDPQLRERIAGLSHLLPVRPGGPVAVLMRAPQAAVVVLGHVGLDGFHDLREIWRGGVVGATVHVRFWRHERSELPDGGEELAAWLHERWQELDDWVTASSGEGAAPTAGTWLLREAS